MFVSIHLKMQTNEEVKDDEVKKQSKTQQLLTLVKKQKEKIDKLNKQIEGHPEKEKKIVALVKSKLQEEHAVLLSDMEKEVRMLKDELDLLRASDKVPELLEKMRIVEQQRVEAEERADRIKEQSLREIDVLTENLQSLSEKVREEQEISRLREEELSILKKSTGEAVNAKEELKRMKLKDEVSKGVIEKLKERLEEQMELCKVKEAEVSAFKEKDVEIATMRDSLDGKDSEKSADANDALEDAVKAVREKEEKVSVLTTALGKMETTLKQKEDELMRVMTQLEEKEDQLAKEKTESGEKLKFLENSIVSLKSQLEKEMKESETIKEHLSRQEKRISVEEEKVKQFSATALEWKSKYESTFRSFSECQSDLDSFKAKVTVLEGTVSSLQLQKKNSEENLRKLKKQLIEAKQFTQQNSGIQEQLSSLQEHQKSLIEKHEKVVKNISAQVTELTASKSDLEQQLLDQTNAQTSEHKKLKALLLKANKKTSDPVFLKEKLESLLTSSEPLQSLARTSYNDDTWILINADSLMHWVPISTFISSQSSDPETDIQSHISKDSTALPSGLVIPESQEVTVEQRLCEKFDLNWKKASEQYEIVVKELTLKCEGLADQLEKTRNEFKEYKEKFSSVVARQNEELDDLREQLSDTEELKKTAEQYQIVYNDLTEFRGKTFELEKSLDQLKREYSDLKSVKQELVEKLSRSDGIWTGKLDLLKSQLQEEQTMSRSAIETQKQTFEEKISKLQLDLQNHRKNAKALLEEKDQLILKLKTRSIEIPEHSPEIESVPVSQPMKESSDHVRKLQMLLREGEIRLAEEQTQRQELVRALEQLKRSKKRSHLDLDYLKNVLKSFMENPNEESLIPVIARLLEFSDDELKSIQSKRKPSLFNLW